MRTFCVLSLLLSASCATEAEAPDSPAATDAGSTPTNPLEITTDQGVVEGLEEEGLRVFRGIPYAAPPVGDLRFKPTQEPPVWEGTRAAHTMSPRCPQPRSETDRWAMDEDCLTLNIWAHPPSDALKPVMVWIHGGNLTQGSSSNPVYQGDHIALDGDVIVVSINYRLGLLGYLATTGLRSEAGGQAGNYGLYDQVQALRWIQSNIQAFGGDPDQVTLFGESAGALSVCALMGSPAASDLFARAIMQSGSCWRVTPLVAIDDGASGVGRGQVALDALGCGGTDEVACLRSKSVDQVLAAQATEGLETGLVVEGQGGLLPSQPIDAFEAGLTPDRPVLIGSNRHESSLWEAGNRYTPESYQAWVSSWVNALFTNQEFANYVIVELLRMYPANNDLEAWWARVAMDTDIWFTCPALALAKVASGGSEPAYAYFFDHSPENSQLSALGASHGFELSFLFGTPDQMGAYTYTPTANGLRVGNDMRTAWTDFAHGRPPAPPEDWPEYNAQAPRWGEFATSASSVVDEINEGRCDRLRPLYLAR